MSVGYNKEKTIYYFLASLLPTRLGEGPNLTHYSIH
jgi:hypothetical protein